MPRLMKAASITGATCLSYADLPCPQPTEGEVLVEVALTGICGSDLPRYLAGQVHAFPQVLGHEFSGVVVAVGPDADESLIGARMTGVPLVPCMSCEKCQQGDYALCDTYSFIGSRRQGSMAQYVTVPQINVVKIRDEVTMLEAAFFEPATVALHGASLVGFSGLKPRPQARVAIIGAGTVGILLAQALKGAYEVSSVVLLDVSSERLATAQAVGLLDLIDTTSSTGQVQLEELARERALTHVFDAAGASDTIALACKLAGPRASVCLIGTPKSPVNLSVRQWENINRKELTLRGSWMSYSTPWPGAEWHDAAELFATGTLRIADEMVDTIYPLGRTQEAFERFRDPATVKGKILIDSRRLDW